jgi:ABC-type dipeptide/oligopeptide/nickel transport system permease subunit
MAISIHESEPTDNLLTTSVIPMESRRLDKSALRLGLGFILIVCVGALVVPWLSPYIAGGLEEKRILETPSTAHWLGTDALGRDLLTRLCYGARVSITVGLGTALIALIIGTAYGLVSGFKGGSLDQLMMRVVDIFYGLPDMLIFILLSLLLGRNVFGLLLALGLVSWVRFARIARGQILQAKELLFVEGARAMGASRSRIVLRHILPNILAPILVTLTFNIPSAILAESTLSFIGLGINDPYSAWGTSWGTLVQDGWRAMRSYPHVIFFPAGAIFLTILSFNAVGNALRDLLDVKAR